MHSQIWIRFCYSVVYFVPHLFLIINYILKNYVKTYINDSHLLSVVVRVEMRISLHKKLGTCASNFVSGMTMHSGA